MQIDHLALYVRDLLRTKDFYMRYFGAECNDGYQNLTTGFRSFFLTFADGFRLELMHQPGLTEGEAGARYGYTHIAFSLGGRAAVDALTDQLRRDGYAVVSGPRTTGDGYYESCVLDAEGNQIELTA